MNRIEFHNVEHPVVEKFGITIMHFMGWAEKDVLHTQCAQGRELIQTSSAHMGLEIELRNYALFPQKNMFKIDWSKIILHSRQTTYVTNIRTNRRIPADSKHINSFDIALLEDATSMLTNTLQADRLHRMSIPSPKE